MVAGRQIVQSSSNFHINYIPAPKLTVFTFVNIISIQNRLQNELWHRRNLQRVISKEFHVKGTTWKCNSATTERNKSTTTTRTPRHER